MSRPNILIFMVDQLNGTLFPDGPADSGGASIGSGADIDCAITGQDATRASDRIAVKTERMVMPLMSRVPHRARIARRAPRRAARRADAFHAGRATA